MFTPYSDDTRELGRVEKAMKQMADITGNPQAIFNTKLLHDASDAVDNLMNTQRSTPGNNFG